MISIIINSNLTPIIIIISNHNHDRKLEISTASTKAKSREPAYSQALVQNKIDK